MPRFVIPIDGRNHVFEGPDAATVARFASQWAKANAPGGARDYSVPGGLVDTFNRAVPGLSEMGAGLAAAGGSVDDLMAGRPADFGGHWSQARAHQQSQVDRLRQDHPIAANMTAGLGLAAPIAAALGSGGGSAAPMIARGVPAGLREAAARIAAGTARNALTGAAIGGLYGAAQPGSLRQRIGAANQNLLPGAAAGVAAPLVLGASRAAMAGVDGVRAVTRDANSMASALALLDSKIPRLPEAGDAAYAASRVGRDAITRAEAVHRLPWTVEERLGAVPSSTVAAPDDEYAAADRLQNNRVFKLNSEIQAHFHDHARDYMMEPITDDPDFKGYTAHHVSGIQSRLAELADHYRPQGANGTILADEIAQLQANFTAMAGRTQPEFAAAMANRGPTSSADQPGPIATRGLFHRTNVVSMMDSLPLGDETMGQFESVDDDPWDDYPEAPGRRFTPAQLMASAANDNAAPQAAPQAAQPGGVSENAPVERPNVLSLALHRPIADQGSIPVKARRETGFDPAAMIAQTANDNVRVRLVPPGPAPDILEDPADRDAPVSDRIARLAKLFLDEPDPEPLPQHAVATPSIMVGEAPDDPNAYMGGNLQSLRAAPDSRIPGLNVILPLAATGRSGGDLSKPRNGRKRRRF